MGLEKLVTTLDRAIEQSIDYVIQETYKAGCDHAILGQLCAKVKTIEVKDATSCAEVRGILSEMQAIQKRDKERERGIEVAEAILHKGMEIFDEITDIKDSLTAKMQTYELSDKRRKHSRQQVDELIRDLRTGKFTQAELARKYRYSPSTVSDIINKHLWKD